MNVAENVGNSLTIKMDNLAGAGFVETKIEAFSIEKREHVVEEGVSVREDHRTSHGYHEQVWIEMAILLKECVVAMRRRRGRLRVKRVKPKHRRYAFRL